MSNVKHHYLQEIICVIWKNMKPSYYIYQTILQFSFLFNYVKTLKMFLHCSERVIRDIQAVNNITRLDPRLESRAAVQVAARLPSTVFSVQLWIALHHPPKQPFLVHHKWFQVSQGHAVEKLPTHRGDEEEEEEDHNSQYKSEYCGWYKLMTFISIHISV